jgi:hypothetical protein
MSPSPNSEARKRGDEKATPPPEPLPGYVLTTRSAAVRAGWECIDLEDIEGEDACEPAGLADATFGTRASGTASQWLVIARPPRPRKVTIELDEDVAQRWADGTGLPLTTDAAAVHDACRAALDGDK